ncbi:MAG: formate dehydrogenase accessory sulfurtransferase FdhD [Thermodesulfobacteriota bacterium]
MKESLRIFQIEKINEHRREREKNFIIAERPITIFLNDKEIITLLATPENLKELAVGFLLSEGWLREDKPIESIDLEPEGVVRLRVKYRTSLTKKLFLKRTITSGCGRGVIYYNVLDALDMPKIRTRQNISGGMVFDLMQELNRRSILYRQSGSVHGAAIADTEGIKIFCEDIGRHNAVDKVLGSAFLQGYSPKGKILLTSGRVSSEILVKAAKRRIPFIFSYSGPTDLAVKMAREVGITLGGYIRGHRMKIYAHQERIKV